MRGVFRLACQKHTRTVSIGYSASSAARSTVCAEWHKRNTENTNGEAGILSEAAACVDNVRNMQKNLPVNGGGCGVNGIISINGIVAFYK